MSYPRKILLCTLRDGTKIYETVHSEKEYEMLCELIEDEKERVRQYFMYP